MSKLYSIDDERRFQLLVDGVTDYALYLIDLEGKVVSWNSGARRLKGYDDPEILGRPFQTFYTPEDLAAGIPDSLLATARREGRAEAEGWRVRKDGSRFWASVVLDAIRDQDGEVIGYAKITRDITERRAAQAELEQAQRRLAQAQKMEAIGQLTGGVAHDVNNLMMVISGQTQMLKRRLVGDESALRRLAAIEEAIARGEGLTRQLLTFSRRQRLNPQTIDLAPRVEGFRQMLGSSLGSAIRLEVEIAPDCWPARADIGELELAMLNIAVNARDAMPEGGVLRVTSGNETFALGDRGLELCGDFVELCFSDTGQGIPEDILAKVFEPFFTTKPVGKGTGLGLSQVYGMAHQAGGAVLMESTPGEGTTVRLFLPRAVQGAVEETRSQQAEARVGSILLVEDDPEVAEVGAALLEELGYEVSTAPDAGCALARLEAGERFDLVFSDVVMAGGMDGLALARRIRETWPDLPVLLASGYSSVDQALVTEFRFLRKPYRAAELRARVADLIANDGGSAGAQRGNFGDSVRIGAATDR